MLVTGMKGTHTGLCLKAPRLKFTASSGISFCHPQSIPPSFCKLPGEFRPKKIVKRALLFSIIPVSTIFCHLCTPFWCVFDAVQYVPERL